MKIRLFCATFLCTALACLASTASADTVRADRNHHINFDQFHTYSWGTVKVSNPFDADLIQGAVSHQLQNKG